MFTIKVLEFIFLEAALKLYLLPLYYPFGLELLICARDSRNFLITLKLVSKVLYYFRKCTPVSHIYSSK